MVCILPIPRPPSYSKTLPGVCNFFWFAGHFNFLSLRPTHYKQTILDSYILTLNLGTSYTKKYSAGRSRSLLGFSPQDALCLPFLWSISSTFDENYFLHLSRYYFAKKLQSQTVLEKICEKNFRIKKARVKCWWNWHLPYKIPSQDLLSFKGRNIIYGWTFNSLSNKCNSVFNKIRKFKAVSKEFKTCGFTFPHFNHIFR